MNEWSELLLKPFRRAIEVPEGRADENAITRVRLEVTTSFRGICPAHGWGVRPLDGGQPARYGERASGQLHPGSEGQPRLQRLQSRAAGAPRPGVHRHPW